MNAMRDDIESNSWSEYRREVLKSLNDLDGDIRRLEEKVDGTCNAIFKQMHTHRDELMSKIYTAQNDITQLNTKASMWGGLFGVVGGAVITLILSLMSHR